MKLTLLSKVLIVAVVAAAAAGLYMRNKSADPASGPGASGATPSAAVSGAAAPGSTAAATGSAAALPAGGRPKIVVGVNDFGGAYPALVANDGALPGPNSLFTKAGLDVEIRLVRGSKERLDQFDQGKIDVMLLTLDYVANLYADYKAKGTDLKAFHFVGWSRGNMGIVAKPAFTSIESLEKAKIATTRNTPTHYFSLILLDRSNLTPNQIELTKGNFVFAKKTPDTADLFIRGEVDAVAIWEPHLTKAVEAGGGKLLVSTSTASNLIADVLFARNTFLDANAAHMPAFLEAWLSGVAKLKSDPEGSIKIISRAFEQADDVTRSTLAKIKPATFADNRAFFGLETESSPSATLLTEAGEIWKREGLIQAAPTPKEVFRTGFLDAIKGKYASEAVVEEWKFDKNKAESPALLSKSVSIYFEPAKAELDANTRKIIDRFAEQMIGVFQNAYIRVEGNTDSQGARKANVDLSERRARAVVDYLVTRHRFDPARFVAVGNGPDKPVGDNKTPEGREFNRRTDFRVVPNY
ncbi:phosphate ABC transporter substrate-binding/OmpA family protein [Myxococcota bacterium]|nr:phosphate ABC transporter substrate-binding/OmpA family protein [Myxococcota bacterium]